MRRWISPGADRAVIEPRKIRDYLLSLNHPVGRCKAAFFARLRYTADTWGQLSADLQQVARGAVHRSESTPFGMKYEIRALITGPNQVSAQVVTIWIVRENDDFPRLVTAYPGEPT